MLPNALRQLTLALVLGALAACTPVAKRTGAGGHDWQLASVRGLYHALIMGAGPVTLRLAPGGAVTLKAPCLAYSGRWGGAADLLWFTDLQPLAPSEAPCTARDQQAERALLGMLEQVETVDRGPGLMRLYGPRGVLILRDPAVALAFRAP